MYRKTFSVFLVLFLSIVLKAQQPSLTFTPHWLPQSQFAGYYMALEKGFYQSEGLDVKIVHPSASVNAILSLSEGSAHIISLFLITAISAKNNGVDLLNIAQLSQNSALMFVSKKERGIENLTGLNQKAIGVWQSGFDEVGKALITSNNYTVEWVPILSSINMFMVDGIDALTVMWYNEYYQIINAGIDSCELNTFFFSDYGYNIPEDGLYCLNTTFNERSADLEKFIKATFKGWQYVADNFDETINVVLRIMKENHVPTNRVHQQWMLRKVLELMDVGNKNVVIGELAETDFYKTQSILVEGGYVKNKINFSDFHQSIIKKP